MQQQSLSIRLFVYVEICGNTRVSFVTVGHIYRDASRVSRKSARVYNFSLKISPRIIFLRLSFLCFVHLRISTGSRFSSYIKFLAFDLSNFYLRIRVSGKDLKRASSFRPRTQRYHYTFVFILLSADSIGLRSAKAFRRNRSLQAPPPRGQSARDLET